MNEFKGTPGPWGKNSYGELRSPSGDSIDVWGLGVAHAYKSQLTIANANLITASPELFKAVNDFLNHFEGDIPLWLFEEAEAAVAKALGE